MTDKTKNLGRNVRFNVAIADYRPGQIVRYGDMPDGHRFWVDNKSILQTTRICEFITVNVPEEKPISEKIAEIGINDAPDFDKDAADNTVASNENITKKKLGRPRKDGTK